LVIRKFPSPEIRHKDILDSQYFDMPKNGENTLPRSGLKNVMFWRDDLFPDRWKCYKCFCLFGEIIWGQVPGRVPSQLFSTRHKHFILFNIASADNSLLLFFPADISPYRQFMLYETWAREMPGEIPRSEVRECNCGCFYSQCS
jgi:hypothetical protein